MTDSEFLQQVWRPMDSVVLTNGIKGRVHNVCFTTKSVRIHMPEGPAEWFRCDYILEHKSMTNEPDDISTIENLHQKLMDAEKRIEDLIAIKSMLEDKINRKVHGEILTKVNIIQNLVSEKRKHIEKVDACMEDIRMLIEKAGGEL